MSRSRSFTDHVLTRDRSLTAVRAIAATLLDDANLNPGELTRGVTVVVSDVNDVSDAVVDLVTTAVLPRKAYVNRASGLTDDDVVVVTDDHGSFLSSVLGIALTADLPTVVVCRAKSLPDDIGLHADRIHTLPSTLRDDQIGRVISLVCGLAPGVILDVVGLGAGIKTADVIRGVRRDFPAQDAVSRLRRIARYRADAAAQKSAPVADPVVVDDTPAPVKLADLSGYGAARDWGLQLAADLASYKAGDLAWDDVDRGVLLSGPPGCGKTYFAKALAAQCGVPFFPTSYSDWHGGSGGDNVAKALKKLFKDWRDAASTGPVIVFVDELDSIGARGSNDHNDSWFRTIINAWLAFLDGAEPRTGVVVIAATNLPDRIDPALLRPGRLDRHVSIPAPTVDSLVGVISHHAGDLDDVRIAAVACRGKSPAQVAQVVRDARRVARLCKRPLTAQDVVDVVRASRPRRSLRDDVNVAYHEAGHAMVGLAVGEPLEYVDVDNCHNQFSAPTIATRERIESILTTALAGRAATELYDHGADTGSAGDLAFATVLAASAVAKYGLYGSLAVAADYDAPDVRVKVAAILDTCHARARDILTAREPAFRRLAVALRRRRYLDATEVRLAIESPIARLARRQRENPDVYGAVDDLVA